MDLGKLRRRYFEEALSAYPDVTYIHQVGSVYAVDIPAAIRQMHEKKANLRLSFSDWAAFEIYKVASEMGLRIPRTLWRRLQRPQKSPSSPIRPSLTVRQKSRPNRHRSRQDSMEPHQRQRKILQLRRTGLDANLVIRQLHRPSSKNHFPQIYLALFRRRQYRKSAA